MSPRASDKREDLEDHSLPFNHVPDIANMEETTVRMWSPPHKSTRAGRGARGAGASAALKGGEGDALGALRREHHSE